MGIKSLPRLLLIYSVVVLVFLIIIATNVDVEVKRLRREDQTLPRVNIRRAEPEIYVPKEDNAPSPPDGVSNEEVPVSQHRCDIAHMAFVVRDSRSLASQVLKSLLIHRRCPLHFHFIVSSHDKLVLDNLFNTWLLPFVEYSFYPIDYIKENLSLSSKLASDVILDMSVVFLPYIIPKSVDKLIFLDCNCLVLGDIRELWNLSEELNSQSKLFAVSKSSSLQGSFDTNVMIVNLKLMRLSGWDHSWQNVAKMATGLSHSSHDIINSYIATYPESLSILPCVWFVNDENQLSCPDNLTDYRIIALDPKSASGSDEYVKHLKTSKSAVIEHGCTDLRNVPPMCDKTGNSKQHNFNKLAPLPRRSRREMCRLINKEHERTFVTHLYFYGKEYVPQEAYETTLVTQLSLDRLDKFVLLLSHWDGPMSLALYGTDAQAWNFTKFLADEGVVRDNLIIHIVYKYGRFYPVNHLRNLALSTVTTPYMFLSDADFLPSFGLFNYLKRANKALMKDKKRALVIPAFNGEEGFIYPSSKQDLQEQLDKGSVRMFCVWCAHQTHGQTNYTVWATATQPYKVEWAFHFEPYVVVDRDAPRYDERFIGYGWNKVSQITELKAQGYEFVVLPDVYTIHSPHKRTHDREIWKRKNYKFCINSLWKKFIQDLLQKYGPDCLKENKLTPVMLDLTI